MERNNISDILQKDSIFRVGHVISVDGRTVKIIVDKTKNSANLLYKGELVRNVSVNSYVKIIKGFTKIIGKVEGEHTDEDKSNKNSKYNNEKNKINRILQISLLGFFNSGKFERGIKELPLISNECHLLDSNEYDAIHDFVKTGDEPLELGTLTNEKGLEIKIGINSLFASHIGIFGNTGSGKSYTLSKIYNTLFEKYKSSKKFKKNASFVIIDFNGEYVGDNRLIDNQRKSSYILNTYKKNGEGKFPITTKNIYNFEFWSLILEATEKTQQPFIRRAITSDKIIAKLTSVYEFKEFIKNLVEKVIVKEDKNLKTGIIIDFLSNIGDTFETSNIEDIIRELRSSLVFHATNSTYYYESNDGSKHYGVNAVPFVNKILDKFEIEFSSNVLSKIRLMFILKYHDEIISGFSNQEHLSPLINRLAPKIKDLDKLIIIDDNPKIKNICVISLRDVNVQMRKMLPFIICKQLYENKKEKDEKEKYLNIIIDEAHNILSSNSDRESETWKDYRLETFEEIIKEGRKFGVFLTIASQRPSDISATIISQLHNFFLHRLINNNDIKAVEKTISYLDKVSFESLPILATGTCVFAGLAAQVPVMLDVGKITNKENEPDNKTIILVNNWTD